MSKFEIFEIFVYILYLIFIFVFIFILFNQGTRSETYEYQKKYKKDEDILITQEKDQEMQVPTPHINHVDYTYFNNKSKRNSYNIGNEPQSPQQTYHETKKTLEPLCDCKN